MDIFVFVFGESFFDEIGGDVISFIFLVLRFFVENVFDIKMVGVFLGKSVKFFF